MVSIVVMITIYLLQNSVYSNLVNGAFADSGTGLPMRQGHPQVRIASDLTWNSLHKALTGWQSTHLAPRAHNLLQSRKEVTRLRVELRTPCTYIRCSNHWAIWSEFTTHRIVIISHNTMVTQTNHRSHRPNTQGQPMSKQCDRLQFNTTS